MQVTGVAQMNNQSNWFKEQESKRKYTLLPLKSKLVTQAVALQGGECAQFIQPNTSNTSDIPFYKIIKTETNSFFNRQVAVYHIGTYEVPDESACLGSY